MNYEVADRFLDRNGYRLWPHAVSGGEPVFTPIVYEFILRRLSDGQVVGRYAEPLSSALRQAVQYVQDRLRENSSHDRPGPAEPPG
jgi:hypothetical protein